MQRRWMLRDDFVLYAQRHPADFQRRVKGELKKLDRQLVDAGLMPEGG
jgi:hypothetical protein